MAPSLIARLVAPPLGGCATSPRNGHDGRPSRCSTNTTPVPGQPRDGGIGVLLAEQHHHMTMRVADHRYFIEKGRIAYSGSVEEARGKI
jgi:hypothetical protein